MPKFSELKLIRTALGLSQEAMGKLMGVGTQSAYQAWEANPDKPAGRKALEAAKALYRDRMGREWGSEAAAAVRPPEPSPPLTREEFAEWRGYWKAGTEKLLERLEDLTRRVDLLEKRRPE